MRIKIPKGRFGNSGRNGPDGNRLPESRKIVLRRGSERKEIVPSVALKTASRLLSEATERCRERQFFFQINAPGKQSSFFVFGFGGKIIHRQRFVENAAVLVKGYTLAEVNKKFSDLTKYSIDDVVQLGGSPVLGSRGTAKIEVFKKNNLNSVHLVGFAVPSFKRNTVVVERNKQRVYEMIIDSVFSKFGKNTLFKLNIPVEDKQIIRNLERKFVLRINEGFSSNNVSVEIDFSRKFRKTKK